MLEYSFIGLSITIGIFWILIRKNLIKKKGNLYVINVTRERLSRWIGTMIGVIGGGFVGVLLTVSAITSDVKPQYIQYFGFVPPLVLLGYIYDYIHWRHPLWSGFYGKTMLFWAFSFPVVKILYDFILFFEIKSGSSLTITEAYYYYASFSSLLKYAFMQFLMGFGYGFGFCMLYLKLYSFVSPHILKASNSKMRSLTAKK